MENKNIIMGILAYLGVLVVIPYLIAKDDPFVKFHIKQGLVLLVIEVLAWILSMTLWPFMMVLWLVKIVVFVLMIIGIVNVVQGREKKLPLVGDFSRYFNI